ncbi:MAG: hypothetical protein JW816_02580 [Candidatus Buchananbacteria bacterium]|nr:hypothetical protein [Candidatus Buchananbacteria bacterium]
MSSKVFSILIFLGSLLALTGWVLVVNNTDPAQSSWLIFSLFYLCLMFVVFGLLFLISEFFRQRFAKKTQLINRFKTSVRQSLFFAILIAGWLMLQSKGLAYWWVVILFILILTFLEFFFISASKNNFYES